MKAISATIAIISAFTVGCGSPERGMPDTLTAHFNFSPKLAERLPANHILAMLRSGDYTVDTLSLIETEVADGNQRAHIKFEFVHPSGFAIDYVDLKFSKTQSWMNAELLNLEQMADRLEDYRESARLVESRPLVIVRFEDDCNVSFLIKTAKFLEGNGITNWLLTESDEQITEQNAAGQPAKRPESK